MQKKTQVIGYFVIGVFTVWFAVMSYGTRDNWNYEFANLIKPVQWVCGVVSISLYLTTLYLIFKTKNRTAIVCTSVVVGMVIFQFILGRYFYDWRISDIIWKRFIKMFVENTFEQIYTVFGGIAILAIVYDYYKLKKQGITSRWR